MATVHDVLATLGLAPESLEAAGRESRIRADLGLDSTETTDLQVELNEKFGLTVDLWDRQDYTLGELADEIEGAGK